MTQRTEITIKTLSDFAEELFELMEKYNIEEFGNMEGMTATAMLETRTFTRFRIIGTRKRTTYKDLVINPKDGIYTVDGTNTHVIVEGSEFVHSPQGMVIPDDAVLIEV